MLHILIAFICCGHKNWQTCEMCTICLQFYFFMTMDKTLLTVKIQVNSVHCCISFIILGFCVCTRVSVVFQHASVLSTSQISGGLAFNLTTSSTIIQQSVCVSVSLFVMPPFYPPPTLAPYVFICLQQEHIFSCQIH